MFFANCCANNKDMRKMITKNGNIEKESDKAKKPKEKSCKGTQDKSCYAKPIIGRLLHYSYKVTNRAQTIHFFRDILGMKVLRHTEYADGREVKQGTSGDNRWSRTLVGYGPEDSYFAFELIYNYPIHHYKSGNDLIAVTITHKGCLERAEKAGWPIYESNVLEAPGGLKFHILEHPSPTCDPIAKVTIATSDLKRSIRFWREILGLTQFQSNLFEEAVVLGFKPTHTKVELRVIHQKIQKSDSCGRIAFSLTNAQQIQLEERAKKVRGCVVVPLVPFDMPGKPTVMLTILEDPDCHEICCYEDGPFRKLSQYSPRDEELLNGMIQIEEEATTREEPSKSMETMLIGQSLIKSNTAFGKTAKELDTISTDEGEDQEEDKLQADEASTHTEGQELDQELDQEKREQDKEGDVNPNEIIDEGRNYSPEEYKPEEDKLDIQQDSQQEAVEDVPTKKEVKPEENMEEPYYHEKTQPEQQHKHHEEQHEVQYENKTNNGQQEENYEQLNLDYNKTSQLDEAPADQNHDDPKNEEGSPQQNDDQHLSQEIIESTKQWNLINYPIGNQDYQLDQPRRKEEVIKPEETRSEGEEVKKIGHDDIDVKTKKSGELAFASNTQFEPPEDATITPSNVTSSTKTRKSKSNLLTTSDSMPACASANESVTLVDAPNFKMKVTKVKRISNNDDNEYLRHLYYEKTGRSDIQNPVHDHTSTADDYQYCDISDIRIHGRSLHYVFKVGDRKRTIRFYREILGMKILRHEEQNSGDSHSNNDQKWSKTMVGYGPEEDHFAFQLTYNYPVHHYLKGNDFIGVTIRSHETLVRAKSNNWPILDGNVLEAPGGYKFFIIDEPQPVDEDPVVKITLASSDVKTSLHYWHGLLGLVLFEKDRVRKRIIVGFKTRDVKLELREIDQKVNRAEAHGRIVFSCPNYQQPEIAKRVADANQTILVPLVSFVTPGKPSVKLLILADPDGHEICFVEDLAFRQISHYAPEDETLLNNCLLKDIESLYAIGEPSKEHEYKLIEQSVKKAEYKGNVIRKTVSISLQSELSYGFLDDGSQYEDSSMLDKTSSTSFTGSTLTESTTSTDVKSPKKSSMSPKKSADKLTSKNLIPANPDVQISRSSMATLEEYLLYGKQEGKDTEKPKEIVKEQKRKLSKTKILRFQTSKTDKHPDELSREGCTKDLSRKPSIKTIKNASPNSSPEKILHQDPPDDLTSVKDVEAAIQKVVTSKLEEALNKVVCDKLQEAVSKAVSDKMMESVAKAVAQIESSMLKVASEKSLPMRGISDIKYSPQIAALMEDVESTEYTDLSSAYDENAKELPSFLTLVDLSPDIRPEEVVPTMFNKKKASKVKPDSTKVSVGRKVPVRSVRANSKIVKTQAKKL